MINESDSLRCYFTHVHNSPRSDSWTLKAVESIMPWHPFIRNEEYSLDDISKIVRERINEGGFKNSKAAWLRLEDMELRIQNAGVET